MKKIAFALIGLTALLTACPQPQPPAPQGLTVTGTVVELVPTSDPFTMTTTAWTGGAGKVNLTTTTVDQSAVVNLSQGTLNANGTFSLSTPTSVDPALLVKMSNDYTPAPNCTGTVNVSDPATMGTSTFVTVDATKDGNIVPMLISGQQDSVRGTAAVTYKVGGLMYVDRNVTLNGTQTCTETDADGMTYISSVNLGTSLTKGWNLTTITLTMSFDAAKPNQINSVMTLTSGALPTDKWVYSGAAATALKTPGGRLNVQSLTSSKTLKPLTAPLLR